MEEEDEVDQDQGHRVSTTSSSSRDSTQSGWSAPPTSSGVESDFSEDREEGQDPQPKLRRKPKKKSRSLLGIERFSMLFKNPHSPGVCRRAQTLASCRDKPSGWFRPGQGHPLQPQRHVCVRRRPILSCSDPDVAAAPTSVRVVVFGGDREAGRLARAYSDLQQRENRGPRLTKMCRLQFYLVPCRRRTAPTEGQTGSPARASVVGHVSADSPGASHTNTSSLF